jgi:hypothetical protein
VQATTPVPPIAIPATSLSRKDAAPAAVDGGWERRERAAGREAGGGGGRREVRARVWWRRSDGKGERRFGVGVSLARDVRKLGFGLLVSG